MPPARPPLMEAHAEAVAEAKAALKAAGLRGSVLLTSAGMGCVAIHVTGVGADGRAVPRMASVENEEIAVEVAIKRCVRDIIAAAGGG